MLEWFATHYWELGLFFLFYFGAINLIYIVLLALGSYHTYERMLRLDKEDLASILHSNSLPEITFMVPVYNEKEKIRRCIDNLLSLRYAFKKILIINDGSDDGTFEILKKRYNLKSLPIHIKQELPSKEIKGLYQSLSHPEIMVVDKENGEKYDALNAGINVCHAPYFITVDADTVIDDTHFESIVRSIMMRPETIAIGAAVRVFNGCKVKYRRISTKNFPKGYLVTMQVMEYLRSFLMRQGWNYTGGNFCIAGAFTILSLDAAKKVGGFAPTFCNDLEMVIRLHRFYKEAGIPYRITYLADPVAFTRCPDTYKGLAKQRMIWHRGLLETLWYHKKMFFNPKYGPFGMFVYPFAFFGEALEPLIEILGFTYVIIGIIFGLTGWSYILLILLISWGFSMVFSLYCLVVEEFSFRKYRSNSSLAKLILYALIENFGYRQMTLLWRANGFRSFFARWKKVKEDTRFVNEHHSKALEKFKGKETFDGKNIAGKDKK